MERLGERVFTDIDYASYGKFRNKMVPFFEGQGYSLEKRAAMVSGGTRLIFFAGAVPMIDVFMTGGLQPSNRVQGTSGASSVLCLVTDLLLQKLQIVQINGQRI